MKKSLVSVIVPVYNLEAYLPVCIRSVIAQSRNDFELILIDDGSTDGSPAAIAEWAALDSRIRVLRHANCGPGASRNRALDSAGGDFVCFLDGDDALHRDFLRYSVDAVEKTGADYLTTKPYFVGQISNTELTHDFRSRSCEFNDKDACLRAFFARQAHPCGLFRKAFLDQQRIRFTEGHFYEDIEFTYRAAARAQRVVYDTSQIYFYLQRAQSTMRSSLSAKNVDDVFYFLNFVRNEFFDHDFSEQLVNDLIRFSTAKIASHGVGVANPAVARAVAQTYITQAVAFQRDLRKQCETRRPGLHFLSAGLLRFPWSAAFWICRKFWREVAWLNRMRFKLKNI